MILKMCLSQANCSQNHIVFVCQLLRDHTSDLIALHVTVVLFIILQHIRRLHCGKYNFLDHVTFVILSENLFQNKINNHIMSLENVDG